MKKKYLLEICIIALLGVLLFPFFYRSNYTGKSFLKIVNQIPLLGRENSVINEKDLLIMEKGDGKKEIGVGYFKLKQDGKNYTLLFENGLDYQNGIGLTILAKFENIFGKETTLAPDNFSKIAKKVDNYLKKQEKLEKKEPFTLTFGPEEIKDFGINGLTCGITDLSILNEQPCIFIGNLKEWIIIISDEKGKESLKNISIKIE